MRSEPPCLAERHELPPGNRLGDELEIPVGHERDLTARSLLEARREARQRRGVLDLRRAGVDDAGEQELRKAFGHGLERRQVEVDADPAHGEIGEALEERRGVAERQLKDERASRRKLRERVTESGDVRPGLARKEWLRQDEQLHVERLDGGREHGSGSLSGIDAGRLAERVRGRQRHETRPVEVGDGLGAERPRQSRGAGCVRRSKERVRVEKAREGTSLQPLARVDQGPEEILPGQHAVGEEVETRLGLRR